METEDLARNESSNGEPLENVVHDGPDSLALRLRKSGDAFVIKAVYLVDTGILVVSSDENDLVGIRDLQRQQEKHDFETFGSSIHKISIEQILHLENVSQLMARIAERSEEAHKIIKLAVDVSEDSDRRLNRDHARLVRAEDLLGGRA